LRISLARDLTLEVQDVVLSQEVLAFMGDGLPRQVLVGTCSLQTQPQPRLVPRPGTWARLPPGYGAPARPGESGWARHRPPC
jgi:hypothetical protein